MRYGLTTVLLLVFSPALASEPELVPLGEFPARLVAVYPGDGAAGVSNDTTLRMRFDEPIDPSAFTLNWERGGFLDIGDFSYRPDQHDLVAPVRLLANREHRVGLGDRFRKTLRGADGLPVAAGSWEFSSSGAEEAAPADRGVLESITPPAGSTVPQVAWIRATFNQPVQAETVRLEIAETRKPTEKRFPPISVDAAPLLQVEGDGKTVALPIVFPPGWEGDVRVTIGDAKPFTVAYTVGEKVIDRDDEAFTQSPESLKEVRSIVERARFARRDLRSAVVTARSRSLRASRDQLLRYQSVTYATGVFRFQGDRQFTGDVSGWMSIPFAMGSDGESSWFSMERPGDDGERALRLVQCDSDEIDDVYVSIADAFAAERLELDEVLEQRRLSLVGEKILAGATCHVVRSWDVRRRGPNDGVWLVINDWWIDAQSSLPRRLVKYHGSGSKQVTDFHYTELNEAMPDSAFAPPPADVAKRLELQPLGAGYGRRFLRLSDGADGRVSARWGKKGTAGSSSSGLN